MNLDFVNNLFNNLKENKLAKDFMNELSDYLENNEWNNLLTDDLTIKDTKIISKYKDKTIIVISHRMDNNDLYDRRICMEEL